MFNNIIDSIKSKLSQNNENDDNLNMLVDSLMSKIKFLERENEIILTRIGVLEKNISELQNKQTMHDVPDVNNAAPEKSEQIVHKEETIITHDDKPKEHSDWIYFSAPDNDIFKVENCIDKSDQNVCFRINEKSLAIEFIHSEIDSRLLAYRNECLLPVCEIINNVSSATSIKMEKPGKVKKQGENYIIDTNNKIKIKLL